MPMSTSATIQLRTAGIADATQIAAIYNPYILDTTISFEEQVVTIEEMAQRIINVQQDGLPWLVASVALHEILGFEKVAHFAEVGFKLGRWIDVGYWQKIL